MALPFFVGWLAEGTGSGYVFSENTASGYARQGVTLASLSNGQTALTFGVTFTGMSSAVTVTQRALFDAGTGGNLLQFWNLVTPVAIAAGGTDTLAIGALNHNFPALNPVPLGEVLFPAGTPLGVTSAGQAVITGVAVAVTNGVLSVSPFGSSGSSGSSGGGSGSAGGSVTAPGTSGSAAQAIQGVTGGVPLMTADANGAAFGGVVALTPGTAVSAARSLGYLCTGAGNITLTLADGSSLTVLISTANGAFQTLPFAVTQVTLGTGTAASFWNLK